MANSADAVYNEKAFYNIDPNNVVLKKCATGITDYINKNGGPAELDQPVNNNPNGSATALSEKLYLLNASDGIGKTGLGITLKVMSGDRIDIYGKSYYFNNNTGGNNYQVPVLDILSGLLGAPTVANDNHYGWYKNNGNGNGNTTPAANQPFLYYYHPDHVGSTNYVTDDAGEVYEHMEYIPFGEMYVQEHSNANRTPYLFNGKELDEETGLYYYGERYYDPVTSIWQSADPLPDKVPGWTPYRAFNDNPIKYVDPNGALEYESAEAFAKANNGKTWAKDRGKGDWLRGDREYNTSTWRNANEYNLQQKDGYKQYTTIAQRTDFYGWYAVKENLRGGQTNWAGAAFIVAKQMTLIDNFSYVLAAGFGKKDASDLLGFAHAGNKAIFEDVFDNLRGNMNGAPKKGGAALEWDRLTLHHEQFDVVDPIYKTWTKYKPKLGNYLYDFAAGNGLMGRIVQMPSQLKFKGNIMNPQDRYNHGMNDIVPFYLLEKQYSKPR